MRIILLLFFIFITKNAYAYIEPGIISLIINGVIGFFAAAGIYAAIYYNKLKNLLKKLLNLNSKNKNK